MSENQPAVELNLDGLVGPTHLYSGLSAGNRASIRSGGEVSDPRHAALQGLAKMQCLADYGIPQAVLPPQERPDLEVLRRLGFTGTPAQVLRRAASEALPLLRACSSASSMWAANAATVAPSVDARDGKVHFTPANLVANLHRSIETATTGRILRAIFADPEHFVHHDPLPATDTLGDEGAANHMRLCEDHGARGLHVFVYGRRGIQALSSTAPAQWTEQNMPPNAPRQAPARQTLEASAAVARLHQLGGEQVVLVQQDPAAIDAGVFHNDVIATANESLLLYHEQAFRGGDAAVETIRERYTRLFQREPAVYRIRAAELSLAEAVRSYLFNSQIVTLLGGRMVLLAAEECRDSPPAVEILTRLVQDPACPIAGVEYLELNQSMRNGGGPACLRLRVVLTQHEFERMHPGVLLTPQLGQQLRQWISRHYRDRLTVGDLGNPQLLDESERTLEELTRMLRLGTIYRFQR